MNRLVEDIGGALSFTANLTEASMTEWEGVVDAYDTAAAGNKATWFCIVIPGLTKALYFTGQPHQCAKQTFQRTGELS